MYAIYIIAVFSRSLLLIEIISKSSVDWSRCVIIHASLLIPTRSLVWTVIRCVLVMVRCQILKIDTVPARYFTTETSFETQRASVVPHRVPSYCGTEAYVRLWKWCCRHSCSVRSGVTRIGDTRGGNWGCHPSIFPGDPFLLIAVIITIAFYCFHSGTLCDGTFYVFLERTSYIVLQAYNSTTATVSCRCTVHCCTRQEVLNL